MGLLYRWLTAPAKHLVDLETHYLYSLTMERKERKDGRGELHQQKDADFLFREERKKDDDSESEPTLAP